MDRISALMDGELDDRELARQFERLRQDPALRETWDVFHVIGDAVRGDSPLAGSFNERLSASLQREPTVLAPSGRRKTGASVMIYALSAAASLSAVAMVAWVAMSMNNAGTQPDLAAAPVAAPVEPARVAEPVMVVPQLASVPDEGRMNEYLLAHQGFSPSTALQGVAPYIRSVSTRPVDITR